MNKKLINCYLLCFLIAFSNIAQTSSVTSNMRLKSQESMKIKSKTSSETEAKTNDQPSLASHTFALLEKNHKAAEGAGPEEHYEIEKDNFDLLEKLLAHYIQHQKEGTFPKNKNSTDVEDNENSQGENLTDMIQNLKEYLKKGVKTLKNMKEQIAKNKKAISEALKQNIDREVAIQKIHEQDDEVRQKFKNIEAEEAFEKFSGDGQKIEGLEEIKKEFSKIRNKFANRNKTDTNTNKTKTEVSFVQSGETSAQDGAAIAKACTAGFFSVLPPSFAFKKRADWGTSNFYASGYHRQGALFYKNCKSGYKNVIGVCWKNCNGGYTDFGLTCTRCYWTKCGSGWFKFPCPKCHTYGKHSYGTHIITLFDGRVKCSGSGNYKAGALCYRNCGRKNDGLLNCGIGACAMSTEACLAGVLTMIAELLLGMATFVAFVASFGATGAGGTQLTVAGARTLLKKIGSKASYAFKFAKKIATNGAYRETLKKNAVKAAKQKFKDDTGKFARDKYIELQCRRVADGILDKTKTTNSFDIKSLDMSGISTAVVNCNDDSKQDIECAKAIMGVLGPIDPTGLCAIAGALMQPSIDR